MARRAVSKAQAASEFLMTYGWAIVVILVVVGVLYYAGIFGAPSVGASCVLSNGLTCSDFKLDESGFLFLDVGQATGKTITVTGVGCGLVADTTIWPASVSIPSGGHAFVTGNGVPCAGAAAPLFKGKIVVTYTVPGSGLGRTAVGDIALPATNGNVIPLGGPRWNSSFAYVRPVIINTGVSSNLADFPAYFLLDTSSLISAGKMNSTCKDARIVSAGNNTLDFEIEVNTCNTTATVIWVRLPQTVGSQNYAAYLYYGNSSVADGQNKTGVWRNGFIGVWHFGESSGAYSDSANANDGTVFSSPNRAAAGRFGYAPLFDGIDDYATCGNATLLNPASGNMSIGIWYNLAASPECNASNNYRNLLHKTGGGGRYDIFMEQDRTLTWDASNGSATQRYNTGTLPIGSWMHVGVTYAGTPTSSASAFYINGAAKSGSYWNRINGSMAASTGALYINNPSTACPNGDGNFNGTMDELRISDGERTPDWFAAEYGQTYSVGSEQPNS